MSGFYPFGPAGSPVAGHDEQSSHVPVTSAPMKPLPVLVVSHGAAVFTAAADDPTHRWLTSLAPQVAAAAPRAIVVVSAHDLTEGHWSVSTTERLRVVHDHPAAEWHGERYTVPGAPVLSARIVDALRAMQLPVRSDAGAGLDHGAWLPLRAVVPRADVPVVRLSLNTRATFEQHLAVGAALEPLRLEGVLVLASGAVTHNQQEFRTRFFRGAEPAVDPPAWSVRYDAWVAQTLAVADPRERARVLAGYARHEDFAQAHPTPDHLWPVLVAIGAAGADAGLRVHAGFQHGLSMSAFLFGQWGA
jgi:4,5-DOPA dioxygenase extradiol